MRVRDLIFGALAVVLLVGYIVVGQRVAPLLLPSAAATPTPARPTGNISAPTIGGTIAFVLRGDVFMLTGGQYASRTEDGRAQTPALSPDGQTVYFVRVEQIDGKSTVDGAVVNARLGYSDIIAKPAGGGSEDILLTGLTKVTSGFHQVTWYLAPAPSPDGKRLAVIEAGQDGSSDLIVLDLGTKRLPTRLSAGADWADPSWSPDGKTLVVTAYDSGTPELLLKPADGIARATPLKGLPDGEPYRPTFTPDGKWIVYTLRHDGKSTVDGAVVNARLGYSDIIAKPAGGGSEDVLLTGLTKVPSGFHQVTWYLAPAPSPDGKRLAVIEAGQDGSSDLILLDLATKKAPTRLSTGADWADPSWSPDGKMLVVTAYDSGTPELLLKPADGIARSTPLKGLPEGEPYRPTFTPDGKWIVYTLRHDGKNDLHAFEISTSRDIALTADGQSWNPAVSPDGTQIAFLRSTSFTIDLWVLDLGGVLTTGGAPKGAQRITNGEGVDGANRPSWGR